MTNPKRVEIRWEGSLVGYLDHAGGEATFVPTTPGVGYWKTKGRWVPLDLPVTRRFLALLSEAERLSVTCIGSFPWTGEVRFELGLGEEARLFKHVERPERET